MAQPVLQVKNLRLSLNQPPVTILHDLSFELSAGEILGICGESGSGKSMTALSLINLLPDTACLEGELYLQGQALMGAPEEVWQGKRGQDIAMAFQDSQAALNPTMRVGRQIAESLRIHQAQLGRADRKRRVLSLLEDLGLNQPDRVAKAYPHELSGGMRQRVALALALVNSPEILIADEPTTALDPSSQDQLLTLLADIRQKYGTSIIFISHDIRLVQDFCDRVLIFYAGTIVEEGPVAQVLSFPGHVYTSCLLEAMPSMSKRGQALLEIPGRVPSSQEISALLAGQQGPCLFADRCPRALAICQQERPGWQTLGPDHRAKCYLANQVERRSINVGQPLAARPAQLTPSAAQQGGETLAQPTRPSLDQASEES